MNSLLAAQVGSGVAILLTILVPVLAAGAIVLLFFSIRKERGRFIGNNLKKGMLDKEGFDEFLQKNFASANKMTHFTVFYIEINDAKALMDVFGEKQYHGAVGTLEDRFFKIFPRGSRICSYDYDSIMVFMEEDKSIKELGDLASFCLLEGHKPIHMANRIKLELDLNIGVCSYNAFSADYETFRQNLELALATSKRGGLNRYMVYSSELMGVDTEEYKYYQEIKQAIEDEDFTLYYQPIYDLQRNKAIAYETLLRWNHKTMGVLPPSKFLTVMEQSGDINWVGVWAFEQMLLTYSRHKEKVGDDIIFSMNLSPKQLMNPKLVEDFRRILKKYKVNANEVCLEIVEFAMFDKVPVVAENIERLTQSGFKMAIDDFGLDTSLKMLENLKIDFVKLNKDFVEQSQDDFLSGSVVDALVGYAENKDFKIVASGVEDDVTVKFLKERKIHCGQGYFFGKPQPPENYGI